MKPKTLLLNLIAVLYLIVAVIIGSLPFLISFLCGIFLLSRRLSYGIAFCLIAGITVFSAAYPDGFTFGMLQLHLHDPIRIADSDSFFPSLIWNVIVAMVGVKTGYALRRGYREGRIA